MEKTYTKRQMEILNISINYLSINGIKSFSMRNIAKAIGIKQSSLYDHFENKEIIIKGIFYVYKSEIQSYYSNLSSLKASKMKKIKMYFMKMCEYIQYRPHYMNLIMFEIYQYRDIFENDLTVLLEGIKNIVKEGAIDPDIKEDIDYEWVIIQAYSVLHYFLKNKLLSQNFDVLDNADKYWIKIETLLKKQLNTCT